MSADVAALFADLRNAAETGARVLACVRIRHTGGPVLARLHFDVKTQFFIELALGAPTAHGGAKTQP